ncbi:MAG TPA: TonB-dependent receptor [Blastocatellia bacterium]|nr:TonB-dependent receptor [Blastocatellia bacterium]
MKTDLMKWNSHPDTRGFNRRLARRVCLGTLLMLLLASVASAQQRIQGAVTDKTTHAPVEGATLKLESEPAATERTAMTDAAGRFSFANLSPGNYTLRATAGNYYPEALALAIGPRDTEQIEFELNPVAVVSEQMTVTTGARLLNDKEAATITTLTCEQLCRLPGGRCGQVTDLITPFVSSAVSGHDNLVHLRGNELSLNTFINGVSFFDNPHQMFTPGLAPDVIQSVNVITGGFPAEFGNRFGGILDIVTRSGFDANNHGGLTLGSGDHRRNNFAVDFGGHTEKLGYFLYAQGFQNNRFLNTPEPRTIHDFGQGSRSFGQLDYRPGTADFFKLVLSAGGTNFELPITIEDELRGRDFFQRNREQSAVLSWEHVFSSASAISTSVYERLVSSRLMPTSDPISIQAGGLRNDVTAGFKSDYSLYIGSRHEIKAGVDLMLLRLREDLSFDPRENEVEIGAFDFRGRKTGGQASAYFQDQIRPLKNFTANVGLRLDRYRLVTSETAVSPRVNLAYGMPGARTVLHFAYNRFFSPPPIENLLLSASLGFEGRPPGSSRSNHFEAGVNHSFTDKVGVRVTAYWRSDRHSFETTELANVRVFAPTTFARGKAYGLEFFSEVKEIARLGLSGYFGYTAQRVFQTGPVSGGFTFEQIEAAERAPAAFDQVHTAVAGETWREKRSGVWASAAFEYGSGTLAEIDEVRVRLPEHLVANFSLGVDLFRREARRLSLQVNVENATGRVYQIAKESEFTPVQYSPPRLISGSLSVRF